MNDLTIKYRMTYEIGGRKMTREAECSSNNPHLDLDGVERAIVSVRRAVDPSHAPDPRVPFNPEPSGEWLRWFAAAEQSKAKEDV